MGQYVHILSMHLGFMGDLRTLVDYLNVMMLQHDESFDTQLFGLN